MVSFRFLVADTRRYTLPCRSVGRSVRPSHFGIPSTFRITAPAQLSATGLPCIRPCFFPGFWNLLNSQQLFEQQLWVLRENLVFQISFRIFSTYYSDARQDAYENFDHTDLCWRNQNVKFTLNNSCLISFSLKSIYIFLNLS